MKKKIITLTLIIISVLLVSENSGEYGFQMLNIVSSANLAGQAETGTFSNTDAFCFLTNPTSGVVNKAKALSVSQNFWLFDTNVNNIGYINSNGKSSFGIAFSFIDYGKIDARDDTADIIGEFHPIDLSIATNFAYRITPNHFVGINLRILYENIYTASSYGFSSDIAYTYVTPIEGLKLSTAIKHLGKTSEMSEETIKLPVCGEISAAKVFEFPFAVFSTEAKLIKRIDDNKLQSAFGINAGLNRFFSFRLGYKLNSDAENISTGFGIIFNDFMIDYAFIPFKYEISNAHIISISYKL